MIRAGITGGMASGKSAVCRVWREMGAYVLDADQLAKDLMRHDPELRRALVEAFGEKTFRLDGSLDREWIADQAFVRGKAGLLNSIVHPVVRRVAKERMDEAERRGFKLGVREAALLLSEGRPEDLDVIVWVRSEAGAREQRAVRRDPQLDPGQIRARMAVQPSDEAMMMHADLVIDNDGDLFDLERKARECFQQIIKSA